MLNQELARKYGLALFEIAKEEKKIGNYGRELQDVTRAFLACHDLVMVMSSPKLALDDKKALLKRILLKNELSKVLKNFLYILVEKRRFGLLAEINEIFQTLSNEEQGIVVADCWTAMELKNTQQDKLADKLAKLSNKKIKLRTHLDESLIGGIIVKIGDKKIDGSVKGKLVALKAQLMAKQ